uniref:Uncharacterized protein n=1 Tax=Picea glauca TaxID=3330 RepID=A0A101LWH3_PICGL|nr:hypothetical protein ABT39_MTgene1539 [Picea glauca]
MKNMSNLDLYLYSLFVYTHSQVFYYSYWKVNYFFVLSFYFSIYLCYPALYTSFYVY